MQDSGYVVTAKKRRVLLHGLAGLVMLLGLQLVNAQSIYTCTDAKGKKLTSDRPIAECVDREQRELNRNGSVRRSLSPTMTAVERAQQEEANKLEAEERNREVEERKRNRSLLVRYPDRESHDKERALALAQVDRIITEATKRMAEIMRENKALTVEADFYQTSKTKISPVLTKKIEQNQEDLKIQQAFLGGQEEEKKRIAQRFDEEVSRLSGMWAKQAAAQKNNNR